MILKHIKTTNVVQIDVTGKQSAGRTNDLRACGSQVASVQGQLLREGGGWPGAASASAGEPKTHPFSRMQLIRDADQAAAVRGMSL